jgi:hypothetical protein
VLLAALVYPVIAIAIMIFAAWAARALERTLNRNHD